MISCRALASICSLAALALCDGALAGEEIARFESGNSLYAFLTSSRATERTYARGFIVGVADSGFYNQLHGNWICVRAGVTVDQVADVVKSYLKDNPSTRDTPAEILVSIALAASFPCPPGSR